MLAATRARPRPATRYVPAPPSRRDRLVAALAAQRGRALGDEARAPARDRGRRRLARALGRELAAGRADLLAAVAPDGRPDAGRAQASPRSAR